MVLGDEEVVVVPADADACEAKIRVLDSRLWFVVCGCSLYPAGGCGRW